jgi:GWxTD domain-containing protein
MRAVSGSRGILRPLLRWFTGIAVLLGICLALSMGAPGASAQKNKDKDNKEKLSENYREWLNRDVVYIITREERKLFLSLATDDARDKFIDRFWEIRNPTPGLPSNEYKDEIYSRIAFANSRYSAGSNEEGWRTDRGHAYIVLGPPAQKQSYYNAANLRPIETWFYSNVSPALPAFFTVMFYQRDNVGDFRFYSPTMDGPTALVTGMETINDKMGSLHLIQDSVGPEVAHLALSLIPGDPVDMSTGQAGLASDVMLGIIKDLANHPITKADLERRRAMLDTVTSRLIVEAQDLEIVTLPVLDSQGLTRLDYAIRLRNPSELTLTEDENNHFRFSVEVRVRVFSTPDNKLIFTQQKSVADNLDSRRKNEIKDKTFGYEGILPLPPGKYRLDFLLTDWSKKVGFHAQREVTVPTVKAGTFVVPGIIPFTSAEMVDPAVADLTPFSLAGVKFTPLVSVPPILPPGGNLQVAYQVWTLPEDPRTYANQKLEVEYATGQPAARGGATIVKDEIGMDQFAAAGSLVNGKKLSLEGKGIGNYMLTLSVDRPDTRQKGFGTLIFKILGNTANLEPWDVADPSIAKDAQTGTLDQDRGLCYLTQGQVDQSRFWFRRALDRDHSNDAARARLVDAYFAKRDYAAVAALFDDAGITEETDSATIIRIADSLRQTGSTNKAVSLLERTLQTRPEDGPLYLALAGCYQQMGNSQKAAELTRKAKAYPGGVAAAVAE